MSDRPASCVNGRDGHGLSPLARVARSRKERLAPAPASPQARSARGGVSWRRVEVRRAQDAAGCTRERVVGSVTAAEPGRGRRQAAVPYASVPTHQCMCPVPILQVVGGPNCQLVDVLDACARAARSLAKEVSVGDAVARGPVSTVRPTRQSSRPAPVMYQQTACYQNNTRHNSEAMLNRQINSIYFVFIDSIGTG